MAGEAAQQALAQAGAMLDNATSLVENAVQDALAGANEAIDQAREMLAGAGEQALRDALAEVRGPLDDAMGELGTVLDALPEEFPELPVALPASDCPSVKARESDVRGKRVSGR